MTLPPIFLIDVSFTRHFLSTCLIWPQRIGRRQLLLTSVIGALSSLVLTGYGLDTGMMVTSSISIVTFVMQALLLLFFVSCPIYLPGPLPSDLDPFPSLLFPKWLPLMYGLTLLSSTYTEPL
jgi:hypothetical protein